MKRAIWKACSEYKCWVLYREHINSSSYNNNIIIIWSDLYSAVSSACKVHELWSQLELITTISITRDIRILWLWACRILHRTSYSAQNHKSHTATDSIKLHSTYALPCIFFCRFLFIYQSQLVTSEQFIHVLQ